MRKQLVLTFTIVLSLAGCSDDTDDVPSDASTSDAAQDAGVDGGEGTVESTLTALGVDITPTPRVDRDGDPLPDSYAPLGSRPFVFKHDEVLFAGLQLEGQSNTTVLYNGVAETRKPDGTLDEPLHFDAVTTPEASWDSTGNALILKRNATAADIDGDGRDEVVVVLQRMVDEKLYVLFQDDEMGAFAASEAQPVAETAFANLSHIELVAGDFDADGVFEVAVAVTQDGSGGPGKVTLLVLKSNAELKFALIDEWTKEVALSEADAQVSVGMAAGNLDDDSQSELALVVNELVGTAANARLLFFDGGASTPGFADLGPIDLPREGGPERIAIGDCAIGDVDGNGESELVVGGVFNVNTNCDNPPDMLFGTYALSKAGLQQSERATALSAADLGPCESAGQTAVRAAFINVLDADGDGDMEVAANQAVLDFDVLQGTWQELDRLESGAFLPGATAAYTLDRSTNAVAVAEVTGDQYDDLIYVTENASAALVWGASEDDVGNVSFGTVAQFPLSQGVVDNPVIAPANVDQDSFALSHTLVNKTVVFTEPLLVATLAAAPCYASEQNTDACTTSFGQSTSSGNEQDFSFTVAASIIVGLSSGVTVPLVKVEAETEHKISVALTATGSHSYSVEKSVSFETGPIEDTVIFTTVPYDRYTYEILSHPNPTQVGQFRTYLIPRDPITVQVERSFYNQHVLSGSPIVGTGIFSHTPGDPTTYPTTSERDDTLSQYGGLVTDVQTVGQGEGSVEVGLDVSEEWGGGGSLALGYEFSAKATAATFIAGYSVGVEAEFGLYWSRGMSASYRGTVGNLSASAFGDKRYSFGLFTYKAADASGREFHVLNYWVE